MYFVNRGDCCVHDLALEWLEYDCLILDSKLRKSNARDYFAGADVNLLMIEDTNDISILSRTSAFDVGEEFMFQIGSHIGPKKRRMQRER